MIKHIRKGDKTMMYIYCIDDLDLSTKDAEIKKIINEGTAVVLDPDEGTKLLSRHSILSISDNEIQPEYTLEEYLDSFNGGEYYNIDLHVFGRKQQLQPSIEECISILQDSLYSDRVNNQPSYADRIYNADDPIEEIMEILKECLLTVVQIIKDDLTCSMAGIEAVIKSNEFKWD